MSKRRKKAPKKPREPQPNREGYLGRDGLSIAEREELATLASEYMQFVRVVSASRHHATVHILDDAGAATVWKCLERKDGLELQKTRLGDGSLHFKSYDIYRFAVLRCKEHITANRQAHAERNEKAAANPSPLKRKRVAERINRAKQHELPFLELHTKPKKTTP